MSNVHICLKDILGVAVKCEVIFYPGDTPFQNGTALAISGRRSLWLGDDGTGSVILAAGRYAVRFGGLTGNTDTLIIEVPSDSATYELTALIRAGNWVLPFRDCLQSAKNLADIADAAAAFGNIKQPATTAATGAVQLATQAEVNTGTNAAKAVTPATLAGQCYQVKAAAFTAVQGGRYALNTSAGSFSVTLDSALAMGGFIDFADAFGTWNANPPTFLRNGFLLEGAEVNYIDSAQGTFLRILNVGGTVGLRILEAGTKPHNLTLPTIAGKYIGQTFTSNEGTWTGAPSGYAYQWQSSTDGLVWVDILDATASTFTPNSGLLGACIRVLVAAANANGTSLPVASAASAVLVAAPFPAGAVAAYHFDSSSTLTVDATGNGHTLSNNNGVTCVAGKLGSGAAGFSSSDGSYFSSAHTLDLSEGYSICAWAKILPNSNDGYRGLVKVGNDTVNQALYAAHANAEGAPLFSVALATSTIKDGGWHFLAATMDADSNASLYVDGALVGTGVETGNPISSAWKGSCVSIGCDGGGSVVDGGGDEVVIFNRAISATEVAQIYNNGNGLAYPA